MSTASRKLQRLSHLNNVQATGLNLAQGLTARQQQTTLLRNSHDSKQPALKMNPTNQAPKADADGSSPYTPQPPAHPPNSQYYMAGPVNSYANVQAFGRATERSLSTETAPSPFQVSAGMMTTPQGFAHYANSPQNMPNMTNPPFAQYYTASPLPFMYGQGMPVLSPMAHPFQPFGGGPMLSTHSTPFQPSHIMPVNSSPAVQTRSYSMRKKSPSPRSSPAFKNYQPTLPYRRTARQKPEPTRAYLKQSEMPIQPSKISKPLLLIIDLNGTILFRPDKNKPSHFLERPFTNSFLTYALKNHKVMVWSSARPHNVSGMCAKLFADGGRANLVAEWSREHLDLTEKEYNSKSQVYKRLERVWADPSIQATFPQSNRRQPSSNLSQMWDQSNTVLIDDTLEKARGQPYNLIQLPEFVGKKIESDTVLAVLIDYLEILRRQVDVSTYIRRVPFDYKTLKAEYSAADRNSFQNGGAEDSDGYYDPESYNLRSKGKDIDIRSEATNGSYDPESFDPTSLKDTAARSEASNESYDPASFDPSSRGSGEMTSRHGNGKGKHAQSSWTAINNVEATNAVIRRLSDTSLDEAESKHKPAALTIESDDSDSEEGGVRLPSSSLDQSLDSGYDSRLSS